MTEQLRKAIFRDSFNLFERCDEQYTPEWEALALEVARISAKFEHDEFVTDLLTAVYTYTQRKFERR